MCSLAIHGIWKKPDEPFEVYHPRLVLFICHCPSFKATRMSACGAGCELCPLLVWSSPGWLQLCGQPCSCSDPGSSVLTARLPRAQAAAGVQQLSRFSELFIQLAFSAELGCTASATWFKASSYLPAEVKKLSITWDLVLRCELWSSGRMFTHSPLVSLCTVQSIVHF